MFGVHLHIRHKNGVQIPHLRQDLYMKTKYFLQRSMKTSCWKFQIHIMHKLEDKNPTCTCYEMENSVKSWRKLE